jgi:hypothetical protein
LEDLEENAAASGFSRLRWLRNPIKIRAETSLFKQKEVAMSSARQTNGFPGGQKRRTISNPMHSSQPLARAGNLCFSQGNKESLRKGILP